MVYRPLLLLLTYVSLSMSINNNCNLEVNNANAIGKPFYAEKPVQDSIYSCSSSHNCAYSVHVLGIYKADSYQTAYHHPMRTVEVFVNVGLGNDRRPLVLVLSNHEPVQWTLHIPKNVVISTVILSSTLNSSVIFNKSRVLMVDNNLSLYGYGSDHGGGHTSRLLELLTQRLGPISSFTGTYLARKWILNINSTLPTSDDCQEELSSKDMSTQYALDSLNYSLVSYVIPLIAIIIIGFTILICILCASLLMFLHKRSRVKVYKVLNSRDCINTPSYHELPLPKYHEISSI